MLLTKFSLKCKIDISNNQDLRAEVDGAGGLEISAAKVAPATLHPPSLDIIINITRPKPPFGRQGLAGSWGKDKVRRVNFGVFSTSHFAHLALSSD